MGQGQYDGKEFRSKERLAINFKKNDYLFTNVFL